jgi:hypothetical protein
MSVRRQALHSDSPSRPDSGDGPRLTSFVGELAGIVGASRRAGQDLWTAVLGIPRSTGAIQQRIDRVSEALVPHDTASGEGGTSALVNSMDETSWLMHGARQWLWGMANPAVAYFQVHTHRSKTTFAQPIGDWTGLLGSDGSRGSQAWEGLRQSCLAPLIRVAQGLAESIEAGMARFGRRGHAEFQRLCPMGTEHPTVEQGRGWYARFRLLINPHTAREDNARTFARR